MAQKSIVWRHFKVSADKKEKAECQLCDKNYPRLFSRGTTPKAFSTKPLWNHIKSRHPKELKELNRIYYASGKLRKKPKRQARKTWNIEDSRSQAISRKIGKSFIRLTVYISFLFSRLMW